MDGADNSENKNTNKASIPHSPRVSQYATSYLPSLPADTPVTSALRVQILPLPISSNQRLFSNTKKYINQKQNWLFKLWIKTLFEEDMADTRDCCLGSNLLLWSFLKALPLYQIRNFIIILVFCTCTLLPLKLLCYLLQIDQVVWACKFIQQCQNQEAADSHNAGSLSFHKLEYQNLAHATTDHRVIFVVVISITPVKKRNPLAS